MELELLTQTLKRSLGIVHKQDIQTVAKFLATANAASDVYFGMLPPQRIRIDFVAT